MQPGRCFLEKGYLSSAIEEIAKEAGVAKGTVYFYFENKDDLYMSLMEHTTEDYVRKGETRWKIMLI